jgi:hypothetical protein
MLLEANVEKKLSYVLTVICQLRRQVTSTLAILTMLQRSQSSIRDVTGRNYSHQRSHG